MIQNDSINLNLDKGQAIRAQRKEITEHLIYKALASRNKDEHNRQILNKMAEGELDDYNLWKTYTDQEVKPDRLKVFLYLFISRLLGMTFAIKLLETDSKQIQKAYELLIGSTPKGDRIWKSRFAREQELIGLLDEEQLKYIGSVVLGLYDALVEFTGILAGFTLALQNTRTIAIAALITGIAATSSMAASVYISTESVKSSLSPIRSAISTGVAYLFIVLFLVYPYFLFGNPFLALAVTIFDAILAIAMFTYFSSIIQSTSFGARFRKMALISLGVAALTFGISYLFRNMIPVTV